MSSICRPLNEAMRRARWTAATASREGQAAGLSTARVYQGRSLAFPAAARSSVPAWLEEVLRDTLVDGRAGLARGAVRDAAHETMRAPPRRPVDAVEDPVAEARAPRRSALCRRGPSLQGRRRSGSRRSSAGTTHDADAVSAVPVSILDALARHEARGPASCPEASREVGMAQVDAGVEHGNGDATAASTMPGGRHDHVQHQL